MYESMTKIDQKTFRGVVNQVQCGAWTTGKVHKAHIFGTALDHHINTYGRPYYELTGFGCFKF